MDLLLEMPNLENGQTIVEDLARVEIHGFHWLQM
jgi:hypothetical protein